MRNSIIREKEKVKKTTEEKKGKKALNWLSLSAVWLLIWQLAAWLADSQLLLPGPADALRALLLLLKEKEFYLNAGWTIGRCLMVVALSFAAGVLASWAAYRFSWARRLLSLPVAFLKAVPVMAVVIYIILLADSDWVAVIVGFFLCFPVVYTNLLEGLDSVADEFLELVSICRVKGWAQIRLLFLPGILTQMKAACQLIAGLSWKAVVAAEVLSIPRYSLGYEMVNAKYYLETPALFAYILVIVALSWLFAQGVKRWMKAVEWKPYQGSRVLKNQKGESRGQSKDKRQERAAAGQAGLAAPEVVVSHLDKAFAGKEVLKDFSMTFPAAKVTALMGPSGQGKTTLMRIIAGLDTADRGQVRFRGRAGLKENSAKTEIAFLFQEERLLPWLNVFDNMALPLLCRGLEEKELRRQVENMAENLELLPALYQLPGQLSGGMRSRAALGRTFFMEGKLMILDEPFKGIDEDLKKRILNALWKKNAEGRTVILVTHNREDAAALAERIVSFEPMPLSQ